MTDIVKELAPPKGRFVARMADQEAHLDFTTLAPDLVSADRTLVPEAFKGLGIGVKLVEALVKDARENGYKVQVICPFVAAQRARHPEWHDVLTH